MSERNFEQLEAVALNALQEWLTKNVKREHIRFGLHEGQLACFIDLKADKQDIVFVSIGAPRK